MWPSRQHREAQKKAIPSFYNWLILFRIVGNDWKLPELELDRFSWLELYNHQYQIKSLFLYRAYIPTSTLQWINSKKILKNKNKNCNNIIVKMVKCEKILGNWIKCCRMVKHTFPVTLDMVITLRSTCSSPMSNNPSSVIPIWCTCKIKTKY